VGDECGGVGFEALEIFTMENWGELKRIFGMRIFFG
jgi:hypothetical protein